MKFKKILSIILALLFVINVTSVFSACSLINVDDTDNSDLGEISNDAYTIEFQDAGNGTCVISNINFNPEYTDPITVTFPTSYDGKRVVGINYVAEGDVLPVMVLDQDRSKMLEIIRENLGDAIASGNFSKYDIDYENYLFNRLSGYYHSYSLNSAKTAKEKQELLEQYPVLAVVSQIYVLSDNIDIEKLQELRKFAKKYGITEEYVSHFNENLYNTVVSSNVKNKAEILAYIPGYKIVIYPENVKELVFSDLDRSLSRWISAPSVEKVTVSVHPEHDNIRDPLTLTFFDMKSLKQIISSDADILVSDCYALEQVDFTGKRAYLTCVNGKRSSIRVVCHDSVKSLESNALVGSAITEIVLPDKHVDVYHTAIVATGYYNDGSNWENGALYIDDYLVATKSSDISGEYKVKDGTLYLTSGVFGNCNDLTSVVIPDSVKVIGSGAFENAANLTAIDFGNGVEIIDHNTFRNCIGLTDINLPDSLKFIGLDAFYGCQGLTSINIPKNVEKVRSGAFANCDCLETITVDSENFAYEVKGNCLIEKESKTLVLGLKSSQIPDDGSVAVIADHAFDDCDGLTSLVIPNGVERIERHAFNYCDGLTSIVISDSVTYIGENAFLECSSLENIQIGSGVTTIEYGTFAECDALMSITVPGSVTKIGHGAFKWCNSLENITISDGVKIIASGAFDACRNAKSITIAASVTEIAEDAFSNCCNLESIVVDSRNSVYLSKNNCLVERESKMLILGCKNSVIPDDGSVTTIGGYAFDCCCDLISITIPSSITSIVSFGDCIRLVEIINHSSLNICVGNYDHGGIAYDVLEVHSGSSKIVNQNGYLFYTVNDVNYLVGYEGSETDLILPALYNGMPYEINRFAFYRNHKITSVTVPLSVTKIGRGALSSCKNLSAVYYEGTWEQWQEIAGQGIGLSDDVAVRCRYIIE